MTVFEKMSVAEALEVSIAAAAHLTDRDAGAIAAARALAKKIDLWDVIFQWACEDVAQTKGRPKVPENDNTSLGTLLKYLDALGLTPPAAKVKPGPESKASEPQQAINEMRERLRMV